MNTIEQLKHIKKSRLSNVDYFIMNIFEKTFVEYEYNNDNSYLTKFLINDTSFKYTINFKKIIIIDNNKKLIYFNEQLIQLIYLCCDYNYNNVIDAIIKNIRNYFYNYNGYKIDFIEMV